jgi:hypothetical protein
MPLTRPTLLIQVSVSTLRDYGHVGLLKPIAVGHVTGYMLS